MKTWQKVVAGILGVFALGFTVLLVVAAMQPNDYRIERSGLVNAQPEHVYAFLNDFSHWKEWSPWEELDPNMTRQLSTPSSGKNAWYSWSGNDKVGRGKMTILRSTPAQIDVKLEFIEPFESVADTHFMIAPANGGTRVTWAMEGHNTLMGKMFGLFMDMDKLVGADFEKGLSKLGRVVRD